MTRFIGVTGLGGHTRVDELLTADRPAYTLVLGTRMGESTSFWTPELTPAEAFIHVDADPAALRRRLPATCRPIAAVADVGAYVDALLAALGEPAAAPAAPTAPRRGPLRPPPRRRPRAPAVPAEIQRVIVDGSRRLAHGRERQLVLLVDPPPALREPGRYRVSAPASARWATPPPASSAPRSPATARPSPWSATAR
jgi:acetolactate synthase-1/2/3 large subunit